MECNKQHAALIVRAVNRYAREDGQPDVICIPAAGVQPISAAVHVTHLACTVV
jgi:hypothetical protein